MVKEEGIETFETEDEVVKITNSFVQQFQRSEVNFEFLEDSGLKVLELIPFEELEDYEKTKIGEKPVIKVVTSRKRGVIPFRNEENRDQVFKRMNYRKKVYEQNH